jgi:transcriptional regulator with XRE-family HTH domain
MTQLGLCRLVHPLRAYRDRHRLTQTDLARTLGVSSVTISRWETGTRRIDGTLLAAVAQKTGIARDMLRPDLAALLQPLGLGVGEPCSSSQDGPT